MFDRKQFRNLLYILLIMSLNLTVFTVLAQDEAEEVESIFTMTNDSREVVFRGSWQFTDPGAVVYHDGMFHMFQNTFNNWPARASVFHLISEDGISWARSAGSAVFNVDAVPYAGFSALVSSVLVEDDGSWVLYFYTLDDSNTPWEGAIGRATADDPDGPWIADPEPVLTAGSEGSWESLHVSHPSVVKTDDAYVMYYTGRTEDTINIGMASSDDGIEWTRYDNPETTDAPYAESDPVFEAWESDAGTWIAMAPQAIRTDDAWAMIYRRASGYSDFSGTINLATSEDGINWSTYDAPPITRFDADGNAIWFTELLHLDDVFYLFIEVGKVEPGAGNTTQIYLSIYEGEFPE